MVQDINNMIHRKDRYYHEIQEQVLRDHGSRVFHEVQDLVDGDGDRTWWEKCQDLELVQEIKNDIRRWDFQEAVGTMTTGL